MIEADLGAALDARRLAVARPEEVPQLAHQPAQQEEDLATRRSALKAFREGR